MEKTLATSKGTLLLRDALVTDADALRLLRLEALRDHPEAYSSDYSQYVNSPSTYWQGRLADLGNSGTLILAFHNGAAVGISGIYREASPKVQHTATIYAVYVQPAWRGLKLTEAMIHACLDWARSQNVIIVKLAVVCGNTPAIRVYTRLGFTVYGVEPKSTLVNGVYHDQLLMALTKI